MWALCGQKPSRRDSGSGGTQVGSAIKVLKSSARADHSFQALKLHFWFTGYIDGVEIVDGAASLIFKLDLHREFHCDRSSGLLVSFPASASLNGCMG